MSVEFRMGAAAVSLLMALSGCVGGPDQEGGLDDPGGGKADEGSSDGAVEPDEGSSDGAVEPDEGTSDQDVEPDEAVPEELGSSWEEVVECRGWDLCLPILVAARDRWESDETFFYPMHRAIDVIFFADQVQLSPNCDGRIGIDSEQNVVCAPEEGDPIVFGLFDEMDASMDEPWEWIDFDYETPARARLYRHVELQGSYYLDIR